MASRPSTHFTRLINLTGGLASKLPPIVSKRNSTDKFIIEKPTFGHLVGATIESKIMDEAIVGILQERILLWAGNIYNYVFHAYQWKLTNLTNRGSNL